MRAVKKPGYPDIGISAPAEVRVVEERAEALVVAAAEAQQAVRAAAARVAQVEVQPVVVQAGAAPVEAQLVVQAGVVPVVQLAAAQVEAQLAVRAAAARVAQVEAQLAVRAAAARVAQVEAQLAVRAGLALLEARREVRAALRPAVSANLNDAQMADQFGARRGMRTGRGLRVRVTHRLGGNGEHRHLGTRADRDRRGVGPTTPLPRIIARPRRVPGSPSTVEEIAERLDGSSNGKSCKSFVDNGPT
jgi:hypothetical protein